MCRRNQVWGFSAIAYGLGLLTGCSMESGFWCCFLGISAMIIGFIWLQKK